MKPENIFLCDNEDSESLVKILDFGISKVTSPAEALDTLTHQGAVLGTAFYMSPEQAHGVTDLDGRSDLYSLGSILFEMLAGRTPYVGTVYHAVLVDICTRDASDVRLLAPQVPEPIARIVARALSRDRDARFATAESFLDALLPVCPARISSAEPASINSTPAASQPSPLGSVVIANSVLRRQSRTRLGKVVVAMFVLALVASAALMSTLGRHFKAQQAEALAKLASRSPSVEREPTAPSASANGSHSQPTAATTASLSARPTGALSSASAALRHHAGDAGVGSSRPPPRSSAANANELRLKTTMP